MQSFVDLSELRIDMADERIHLLEADLVERVFRLHTVEVLCVRVAIRYIVFELVRQVKANELHVFIKFLRELHILAPLCVAVHLTDFIVQYLRLTNKDSW